MKVDTVKTTFSSRQPWGRCLKITRTHRHAIRIAGRGSMAASFTLLWIVSTPWQPWRLPDGVRFVSCTRRGRLQLSQYFSFQNIGINTLALSKYKHELKREIWISAAIQQLFYVQYMKWFVIFKKIISKSVINIKKLLQQRWKKWWF